MTSHETTSHDYGFEKKKGHIYIGGILACIILTLIPFYAVSMHILPQGRLIGLIYVCAIIQLWIQIKCFLRMNMQTEQAQYNTMGFLFMLVILAVIVGGSLWIMYHLDMNMMLP